VSYSLAPSPSPSIGLHGNSWPNSFTRLLTILWMIQRRCIRKLQHDVWRLRILQISHLFLPISAYLDFAFTKCPHVRCRNGYSRVFRDANTEAQSSQDRSVVQGRSKGRRSSARPLSFWRLERFASNRGQTGHISLFGIAISPDLTKKDVVADLLYETKGSRFVSQRVAGLRDELLSWFPVV